MYLGILSHMLITVNHDATHGVIPPLGGGLLIVE